MTTLPFLITLAGALPIAESSPAADGFGLTTLTNKQIAYTVPEKPYVVLRRADIEAVIADNSPVDDQTLPGHRGGYSGVASLKHTTARNNLFVPAYAGLNFEHIHDGRKSPALFEPRQAPMQLRRINENVAELYQAPTPHYHLESCSRYELLDDGTIQMTFECIPRERTFANGYVGLFWASYIHQPESPDIHFLGHDAADPTPRWIRGITPSHGRLATHLAADDQREFPHETDFPLTLVFNFSPHRYDQPWYYGLSHGMAFVQMFRQRDRIRLSQSPSGGGQGNPAWDFQFLVPDYEVGRRYGFIMRALYLPFETPEKIIETTAPHRAALNPGSAR